MIMKKLSCSCDLLSRVDDITTSGLESDLRPVLNIGLSLWVTIDDIATM